jgi:uncharacterized protein involved in cysteine biosynthesis
VRKRPLVFFGLTVTGNVMWFGGLLRLFGEAASRLFDMVRPGGFDTVSWIGVGLAVALAVGVLVAILPWYRRLYRQMRTDAAASRGVPVEDLPSRGAGLRRGAKVIAVVLSGAIVLAVLLPGPLAAGLSILAGLVFRILAVVVAATSAPGSASST